MFAFLWSVQLCGGRFLASALHILEACKTYLGWIDVDGNHHHISAFPVIELAISAPLLVATLLDIASLIAEASSVGIERIHTFDIV